MRCIVIHDVDEALSIFKYDDIEFLNVTDKEIKLKPIDSMISYRMLYLSDEGKEMDIDGAVMLCVRLSEAMEDMRE